MCDGYHTTGSHIAVGRATPKRGVGQPHVNPWLLGGAEGQDAAHGGDVAPEPDPVPDPEPHAEVRGPIRGRKFNPLIRKRLNPVQGGNIALVATQSSESAHSAETTAVLISTLHTPPLGTSAIADAGGPGAGVAGEPGQVHGVHDVVVCCEWCVVWFCPRHLKIMCCLAASFNLSSVDQMGVIPCLLCLLNT